MEFTENSQHPPAEKFVFIARNGYPPVCGLACDNMADIKDPGRVEGGKKAARTAKERYGGNFHREIGGRGGRSTSSRHGSDFFETIGRKGGKS